MNDISDARDSYLYARAEVEQFMAEFEAEWNRPDDELKLALSASRMPPGAWALLPKAERETIQEVLNG
jgi:hypothetical protein